MELQKLKNNLKLYIATDGVIDQEGGDETRFGKSRFEKLIVKNNKINFNHQKDIIESDFNSFKDNKSQSDDITIVGLKF